MVARFRPNARALWGRRFRVVFTSGVRTLAGRMSLNRHEQLLFDYLLKNPEEKRFWTDQVNALARAEPELHAAATRLEAGLWRHYEERCEVAPAFRELAQREGRRRTSLRNLAEHLFRLWGPPRQAGKNPDGQNLGA